ncbi:MAG TPA: choice-of-anchor D domain-containing protein [Actinomycetota bacterium]
MAASLLAIAPMGALTPAAHAATGTITEFNNANRPGIIQNSSSDPLGLAVGSDGNLWFTDAGESLQGAPPPPRQIGRFHLADGSLSFTPNTDWFPNGEPGSVPVAITNSGDNNLWFANEGTNANDVGAISAQGSNPLGSGNPFGVGIPASTITGITLGPDNNLWFTMFGSGNIGHIGRNGTGLTTIKLPGGRTAAQPATATVTQNPQAITTGPDHNLWFTIQQSRTIGRMTPAGALTEFTPPVSLPGLAGITTGSDGNLYVTAEGDSTPNPAHPMRPTMAGNGRLARVTPAGAVTVLPVPPGATGFSPNAIVTGPDGNIWFTDVGGNAIWRFDPLTTTYTKFPVPTQSAFSGNVQPTGMVVGPDGNVWFTENNAVGGLARVTIDPLVQLSPSPVNFGSHTPGSTKSLTVVATNTTNNTYMVTAAPSITGPNAGDFTIAAGNTCTASSTLGPKASCTMTIQFKPAGTGTRSATVALPVNDNAAPHTAILTGVGQAVAPTFGPPSAAFGAAFVHQVTKPVNFSLTNVTGAPVTVNSVKLGQPNPSDFIIGSDTCSGATVPDAGSCTVSVSFDPTTIGARSSNLSVVANGVTLPSSSLSGTGVAAPPGSNPGKGYWEVASDGGIFNFGAAKFFGSTGSISLNKPIVGMAGTPDGNGYWLVATDGGIFAFGDAKFFGSTGSIRLNKPIVGMASTPDGQGYWLVASDGGIFAFGDAAFFGSTGSIHLNKPIVGMVAAPDGQGYWMVATDGGIFAFGSARFFGSTGSIHLNQPIVGMATTPDGAGYWMAATDGGIFAFGDAAFFGSTGSIHLNRPVVGIAGTLDGAGYWMAATDGGIFNFGDAGFFGSTGSIKLNKPMVGLAVAP